jgi:hypothetical protein
MGFIELRPESFFSLRTVGALITFIHVWELVCEFIAGCSHVLLRLLIYCVSGVKDVSSIVDSFFMLDVLSFLGLALFASLLLTHEGVVGDVQQRAVQGIFFLWVKVGGLGILVFGSRLKFGDSDSGGKVQLCTRSSELIGRCSLYSCVVGPELSERGKGFSSFFVLADLE